MMFHRNNKQNIFFISIAVLSFILFFITKYGGIYWVRLLFERGQIDFLNHILMVSPKIPSLTYYLGIAEQYVFGPISQFCVFMTLILVGLPYLSRARPLHYGLAIFLFLLISKWEVLGFPPYGDAIAGPFVEAWWLAKNNFNYVQLYHLPDYSQGGPRTYLFSVFPTYVAFWMKWLREPSLYLPVLHAIVFSMIATIGTQLREISRKVLSDKTAFLLSVLFLAIPLTQSQTEALNMEAPCLFFIMCSAFFLSQRRVLVATLAAIGAVGVKGTGIFACGSVALVIVVFLIREFRKERSVNFRYLWVIFFMTAVPCVKLFSKYWIHDTHTSAGMVGLFNGWPSFQTIRIVRWFVASLLIYLAAIIIHKKQGKKIFYEANIMYLYGTAFFLLLLNFFAVSPRYCFNVIPFLVFSCVYALCLIVRPQKMQAGILVCVVLYAAFFSYGQLLGSQRDHVLLERSLEYRNDLYLGQRVVQTVEHSYANFKIGAPMQYAQMLGIKEMGYANKDLDVFIYGFPCQYGGIEEFSGISNLNLYRTVFVGHGNDGNKKFRMVPEYPVGPDDHILKDIVFGDKEAWIFMGGFEIEKLFRSIKIFLYNQKFYDSLKR